MRGEQFGTYNANTGVLACCRTRDSPLRCASAVVQHLQNAQAAFGRGSANQKIRAKLESMKIKTGEPTESQKFDAVVGEMMSVSHDEIKRREAQWKKNRSHSLASLRLTAARNSGLTFRLALHGRGSFASPVLVGFAMG